MKKLLVTGGNGLVGTSITSDVKIVALDDIREIKTKQIYLELSEDNNYELIDSTSEGNGFCIFIKK